MTVVEAIDAVIVGSDKPFRGKSMVSNVPLAVITGSSSGIGFELARLAAQDGYACRQQGSFNLQERPSLSGWHKQGVLNK